MIKGKSNQEIQLAILEAIKQYRASDPLAPVSLIVSNPSQGWLLRRQLAERVERNKGLPNVQIFTASEFLAFCLRLATGQSIASENRIVQSIEAEKILETETGDLAPAKMHTGTLQLMLNLADEIQWCELNETLISEIETKSTNTSAASLRFVQRLRNELKGSASLRSWGDIVSQILASNRLEYLAYESGLIVSLLSELPSAVDDIFKELEGLGSQVEKLDWPSSNTDIVPTSLYSCPSPDVEVKIAVQKTAEWIGEGTLPSEIAILYPISTPYANLLASELDNAKINWHGNTGTSLANSALPRVAILIAEMAADRFAGKPAITRARFMRWLSASRIFLGATTISPRAIKKLIQDENLYSEVGNWIDPLNQLISTQFPEDDSDSRTQAKRRSVETAKTLLLVIDSLEKVVNEIAESESWSSVGSTLHDFIFKYHLGANVAVRSPEEKRVINFLTDLLIGSLGSLKEVGTKPAKALPQLLVRQALTKQGTKGTLSTGIHVGQINNSALLSFKYLIVVGAGEGMLPSVKSNNPLLPEDAREILRQNDKTNLPPISDKILREISTIHFLTKTAENAIFLYPRGGHASVSSGKQSTWLGKFKAIEIQNTYQSLNDFNVVADNDIEIRHMLSVGDFIDYGKQKSAAERWWKPEFSESFGLVNKSSGLVIDGRNFSSSALETFIQCPHGYFVSKVLNVMTDKYEDEIDEISYGDFGTLLHSVFEDFYKELAPSLKETKLLPVEAIELLKKHLKEKSADAENKGLVGWLPGWQRQYRLVESLLDVFIDQDRELRNNGELLPVGFELGFGMDQKDTPIDVEGSEVFLRGYIDRLDISGDGLHVSVVDYKSGKRERFDNIQSPNKSDRTKLQDIVYDAAARAKYPDATSIDVNFHFFPNGGSPENLKALDFNREGLLKEILIDIKNAFTSGNFPIGSKKHEYCAPCGFYGRRAQYISGNDISGDDD